MDRHVLSDGLTRILLIVAVLLGSMMAPLGCSRREAAQTSTPQAQPPDGPAAADDELPAEPVPPQPATLSADAGGGLTPRLAPQSVPPPLTTDSTMPRRTADSALNPLRHEAAPSMENLPEATPPVENPLRSLSAMPRMATSPLPPAPSPTFPSEPPTAADADEAQPRAMVLAAAPRAAAPSDLDGPAAGGTLQPESMAEPPPVMAFSMGGPDEDTLPLVAGQPSPATTDDSAFSVVQVFYGTDRLGMMPQHESATALVARFLPAGCCVLVTLSLALLAASRRHLALGLLAVGGVVVSLGLTYQAGAHAIAALRQGDKEGLRYTSERSAEGRVELGVCEVTIPRTHRIGEVESPSILRLEIREDAARHVVLRKTERLGDERFYELLRERVQRSPAKELFVFIHGFNVSFEDAARRTAQIHHDLQFAGAPIFFSWPANTQFVLTYPADETNVAWSAPHLKQFLLEVTRESGAESVNLVAHSMGNRALAAALREIALELRGEAQLFNQVILAAPDLDADEFRRHIAPSLQQTARRLTLYASSRDDALLASHLVHRGPRAGDAGRGLVVVAGIDTIDVTAIDSSPWGHSYYGSSDPVLRDLRELFSRALAPAERAWLSPAERDGLTYWIFQPVRTATLGAPPPR